MTEKAIPKTHTQNSIIQKVIQFQRYAEALDEPERPEEIQELLADIGNHAEWVIEYVKLLEKNSKDLKEKAAAFAASAKTQENKAKTYKEYLKQALKSCGYEKLEAGNLMLKLVRSVTYKPKTEPSEADFLAMTDFVETKFNWNREPNAGDFIDDNKKVDRVFTWKESILKAELKAARKIIKTKKSSPEEKAEAQTKIDTLLKVLDEQYSYKLNISVKKIEK